MRALQGNTYPIKEQIRNAGGRWNANEKIWYVPENVFDKLKSLLEVQVEFKHCGQLWEECERCGREPIYMPYGVCEHCAKKGIRR